MMNGVIMSRRGVIYVDEGVGPRNKNQVSHVVPSLNPKCW